MLFTKLSPVCVFYSSSHFYFLDLGQKNSSLEIMIYSFFKQEFFFYISFNFIHFNFFLLRREKATNNFDVFKTFLTP